MRVGLFDSGIGGLTVLKELVKKYPNNDYIYLGDNRNLPYGDKTKEELMDLSIKNIEFLNSKNVDIIIIACGTVSSTCYKDLKEITSKRMFSVITPTNLFLENSNYNNILVLATNVTVNSKVFSNYLKNKNVDEIATPKLAPMIEDKIDLEIIKNELKTINKNYDAIVLGCTHYPIIINELKSILGSNNYINMGELISLDENDGKKTVNLYFTDLNDKIKNNVGNILDFNYNINQA